MHLGLGNITLQDIARAGSDVCPIFGFNVHISAKLRQLARQKQVLIILRPTLHELLCEIELLNARETPLDYKSQNQVVID